MASQACLTPQDLRNFLGGSLSDQQIVSVERHLEGCESCLSRLTSAGQEDDPLLRDLRNGPVSLAAFSEAAVIASRIRVLAGARASRAELRPDAPQQLPEIPGHDQVKLIGTGGMGFVFRARQLNPERLVAVKLVRAGSQASLEELARLRVESTALARLRHPNIVKVFEVGESNGLPYFTMEFVEGGTLAELLAVAPLTPQAAAKLLATLAGAIAAAHAAGVVHRDLKPPNILLTSDGTPMITDFGLAKSQGDPTLTQSGMLMGTPSYMAPELASGHPERAGPSVDVYALGAILYEALTGRPPFLAAMPIQTLHQVLHQEVLAPGKIQPAAPRDLEAICLTCLEKEPGRRYPSADALAADLGRFLAGEPTVARPLGASRRLGRLVRRRPAVAAMGVLTVTAVAVLLVFWYSFTRDLARQKRRADELASRAMKNQEAAEAQRQLAFANLREARRAAQEVFELVRDDTDLKSRGAENLRRRVLGQILSLQQGLIVSNGEDLELLVEAAASYHVLAQLTTEIGSKDEALALVTRARDIALKLAARAPGNLDYLAALCGYENDRALYLSAQGRTEEARAAYEAIIPRMETLVEAEFQNGGTNRHFNLARVCVNLGVMERRAGHLDSAERLYLKALKVNQVCLDRAPCNDYWDTQALCLNSLGVVRDKTGHRAEAIAAAEESIRIRRKLVEDAPGYTPYMKGLSSSYLNLAIYLEKDPTPVGEAGAATAYRGAIDVQKQLVDLHPDLVDQRAQLGNLWKELAGFWKQRARVAEAAEAFRNAGTVYAVLARDDAGAWMPLAEWADCIRSLAELPGTTDEPLVAEIQEILGRLARWREQSSTREKSEALARALHLTAASGLERVGRAGDAARHREAAAQLPATSR